MITVHLKNCSGLPVAFWGLKPIFHLRWEKKPTIFTTAQLTNRELEECKKL